MSNEKIERPKQPTSKSGKNKFVIGMTTSDGGYIEYSGSTELNIVAEVMKLINS